MVVERIQKLIPAAKLIDSSGGNLFFLIPFSETNTTMKKFLQLMETNENNKFSKYNKLKSKINDWGISHPTLEEVFLKLTNKSTDEELNE